MTGTETAYELQINYRSNSIQVCTLLYIKCLRTIASGLRTIVITWLLILINDIGSKTVC